jgi:Domain of unknown function (DU1801)
MARAPKTKPTQVSVEAFLDAVTPDARREDARALSAFMARVTGEPPTLWGPSIVGFGVRHYRTADGREHPMLAVGFSPRKPALVLYVTMCAKDDPLAARLGKFTTGKSCIYVKRLADIDLGVLEAMIVRVTN